MPVQPTRLLILLVLAALTLSACGAGGPDPAVKAVEDYMNAKARADRATVQKLLCGEMEIDLDREALSFDGLKTSVNDMKCARNSGKDTVTCSGAIAVDYGGEQQNFPLTTYRVVQEGGEWKWCGEAP